MSYEIELQEAGKPVYVGQHTEGAIYSLLSSTVAEVAVTYNYSPHFTKTIDQEQGIRWLYGKTGAQTIERLEKAISILGTDQAQDYWEPSPGNAGYALSVLLGWAKQHPQAVWAGD